jgi:hypothetical protein
VKYLIDPQVENAGDSIPGVQQGGWQVSVREGVRWASPRLVLAKFSNDPAGKAKAEVLRDLLVEGAYE